MRNRRVAIERALDPTKKDEIPFEELVRMKEWQTLRWRKARAWRELGNEFYDRAVAAFRHHKGTGTEVAVFACAGVFRTSSDLQYIVIGDSIRYDWSEAHVLLDRIDLVAERAREWWLATATATGGGRRRERRRRAAASELRRHIVRAFGLVTMIFAAVDRENPPDGCPSPPARSATYRANLRTLEPQVAQAELALRQALQREAQSLYGRGMGFGTGAVTVLCALLALAFAIWNVKALYGVALPAGAAGAAVSVLQRMTSGALRLDFNAGERMLRYYGAMRPVIGGLLGYMVFVFFKGSLFPALKITTTAPLATFAGLGFVGGFNERWAQDALVGSARRLIAAQGDKPAGERGAA